ncbi:transposase [Venenivibrio stagnispumantis]|nr:transposase [Venenivibrio stagnispumantis]
MSKAKHIIISRDILGSKNGINLGKTNNQNFVSIPFALLIDMIKYKAKKYGIVVKDKEKEYFTSQANCLTNDIRKVMRNKNIELSGERVERGLYKDFVYGLKFNADINGAVNIVKRIKLKVIDFYFKSRELFKVLKRKLCRPIKFNIYQLQNANLFLHRLLSMPAGISNSCSGLNAEIYKFLYVF